MALWGYQGASKALCELVPMRAVLLATRDIGEDEEIYFNYGSQVAACHFPASLLASTSTCFPSVLPLPLHRSRLSTS